MELNITYGYVSYVFIALSDIVCTSMIKTERDETAAGRHPMGASGIVG